uniref:Pyruvate dehydrogenase E1 component subunit beta n=1 Tax=Mesostigma viride TaxID=41882 RepID=ODPB_MESVI|nr:pyruvate dehydrogenase E1 component beta subunit [Mesostigma viride]Q9MUR4.1 RecName: Full=Pyruvate dehydrogenase E1 component subunit beta [Mesostigma viride]AAF43837.1 beta subunit of pyruvate dehydrogenase E1 component [Mesostigma viride]WKT08222.1 beta subunit of pyruvate dehydrogenase E1 component [Mesostigma viride]WKT08328.1 beta subunit of pyruvate dehydrogenase E1 component [Mesostigma viride]
MTVRFLFEALNMAIDEEMARNDKVALLGEDIGHYGGSYKVTQNLYAKYGEHRVIDTPIAENSFVGAAIGAAMTGLVTVVEGMNMGFILLAFSQISNNMGMLSATSGGHYHIPIVLRGPGGVGKQLGAEHSQRLECYFQSVPGLQIVACSTPYNAKGLLKSAIRSKNPIFFLEHVLLYNLKAEVPDNDYVLPLEKAEIVRQGNDITILTYSRMRYNVIQAVKVLVEKGYDPEIIDLISLKPFDIETIGKSIQKTHKVLIVEESMMTGGISNVLQSLILENFFDDLDNRPMCLSSPNVPTPYSGPLEEVSIVQTADIIESVEQILTNKM